ncbi:hypothetical protein AU476_02295 [Cupriavidus sp. UYMSc13B]|nr:hypothetical protein AU476_02295 [Cupriavidus sp. UYMSc13B]
MLVAAGGALMTAGAWLQAERLERREAQQHFDALLGQAGSALRERMLENERLLSTGSGLNRLSPRLPGWS